MNKDFLRFLIVVVALLSGLAWWFSKDEGHQPPAVPQWEPDPVPQWEFHGNIRGIASPPASRSVSQLIMLYTTLGDTIHAQAHQVGFLNCGDGLYTRQSPEGLIIGTGWWE